MIQNELRNQLFQINNFVTKLLVENVDEDTGEIKDDDVFNYLQDLDVKRTDLIATAVISLKHYKDLADLVESKLKQLRDLKSQYLQFNNTLKNIVEKFVEPGEIIENENFRISWRKSQIVEKDLFLDLEDFAKKFPELVKVDIELKKMEIKKIAKTGVLPEGISLIQKLNIQIK